MTDLLAHIKAENIETQAWIDEAPGRAGGMVVESLEHWAGYGVHTVEQYEHYMRAINVYELYNEVHGCRPSWMNINEMSEQDLQQMHDRLIVDMEEEAAQQAEAQAVAVQEFEAKIETLVASGAGDRATAIRWMRDAEDDEQMSHDDGFFEYCNDLPYGYLKEAS